jgi:prepilin-type processing-associated H-X9-DG protein
VQVYYGNNADNTTGNVTWVLNPTTTPVCPKRLGGKSEYDVLVTDMTRTVNQKFWRGKWELANHINTPRTITAGIMPNGNGGGNVTHIDGHARWSHQSEMRQRWWISNRRIYRFFW